MAEYDRVMASRTPLHPSLLQLDITAVASLAECVHTAREQVLGPQHPDTLSSLHLRAASAWKLSPAAPETRELLKLALAHRETALGKEHPDMVATMHELGTFLFHVREYEAARGVLEKVLEVRMRDGGVGREALETMHWLGMAYCAGWKDGGGEYLRRAYEGRRELLGEQHVETMESWRAVNGVGEVEWNLAGRGPTGW